jgi:hypothetical protein
MEKQRVENKHGGWEEKNSLRKGDAIKKAGLIQKRDDRAHISNILFGSVKPINKYLNLIKPTSPRVSSL